MLDKHIPQLLSFFPTTMHCFTKKGAHKLKFVQILQKVPESSVGY